MLLVGALIGAAFFLSDLRDWGQRQVDANTERSQEFDRRVKAQRHAAIKPELERMGIHLNEAPVPADSTAFDAKADVARPTVLQRLKSFWYRLRGTSATPDPVDQTPLPIPALRDSLGLLPGERMILPNGRVVEYDTTVFRYQPPAVKQ